MTIQQLETKIIEMETRIFQLETELVKNLLSKVGYQVEYQKHSGERLCQNCGLMIPDGAVHQCLGPGISITGTGPNTFAGATSSGPQSINIPPMGTTKCVQCGWWYSGIGSCPHCSSKQP